MVRVKVCGITNLDDALAAVSYGADALGFIFAPSPRQIDPKQVRDIALQIPPFVTRVGVFVDVTLETVRQLRTDCHLDAIQLHGQEDDEYITALGGQVIKAIRMKDADSVREGMYPSAALLLDTYRPNQVGGTGQTFDWALARKPSQQRPVILAGGLNPENIKQAIKAVGPYAVDVSSGVESAPGRKDHEKLARFINRAKTNV